MNTKVKVLEKGVYTHALPENFINIKQFLKVTKNGENAILLRLENCLDYTVTFLKFKVVEYDKQGKVISETVHSFSKLNIPSNELYALSRGILVKRECVDFKIEFLKAKSNRYEYVLNGNEVSVYYVTPNTEKSALSGPTVAPKIRKVHKFNVTKIMVASVVSLLLIILSTYLVVYSNFTKDVYGMSIWLKIAIDTWNSIKLFAINLAIIIANAMQVFFTQSLPYFFKEILPLVLKAVGEGFKWFFTQGLPIAFKATVNFFKSIPQMVKSLF